MEKKSSDNHPKFWKRFNRNRPATISLWAIAAMTFVAIFGYLLAPDDSPNADFQIPEIALRPPNFRAELLPIRLNVPTTQVNFLQKIWSGKPPQHRLVAVEEAAIKGDSIFFKKIGSPKIEKIHLVQRKFSVQDSIQKIENQYVFKDADGRLQKIETQFFSQKPAHEKLTIARNFPLGTDKYGRCNLSRLLLGFRISLVVGLLAVAISLLLGVSLGLAAGYFGGRVDDFITLIINTVWSIPTLLLVFAIVLAMGRGMGIIFLAVGLTMWVDVARVVRGQTLALREIQFVEAARSLGFGSARVLFRHVLPNLLGPVMVLAAVNFATAILLESGLSFLGFGVQPPTPSWGSMLNENYGYALGGRPALALAPAAAIVAAVLAFNLLGNGLRDAFDVKS